MPVAIISDIHGNLIALDAVLNAIAARKIQQIICLGDVAATGPQPREVIARLKQINCPVVMGNMDDWLLKPKLSADTATCRCFAATAEALCLIRGASA